jgi:hypothetical protein
MTRHFLAPQPTAMLAADFTWDQTYAEVIPAGIGACGSEKEKDAKEAE